MTKKTRGVLFKIFVFLFVILTITLSLYATGYRFNLSWPLRLNKILLKTGTLALDTSPKGATIKITSETKISSVLPFFDSQKAKTTPAKIKNLLPGEYTITFNLDGYWPYEKKLRVNPEQTTFLEDIVLFKKSLPLSVFTTTAQPISYSADGDYAWLEKSGELINLKNEQSIGTTTSKKANWSIDGKQLCDGSRLINLDDGSQTNLKNTIGEIEESQLTDNRLIYLSKNNLAIFNFDTKASSVVQAKGTILSYHATGNNLFIVVSDKGKTEIKNFDIKNKTFLNSADLLNSHNFYFYTDNENTPILIDREHKIAYLLSTDTKDQLIVDVIRDITVMKWLDNNKLAYATESEIYIYDLSQTKSYFLTRLSQKINSLAWSSNNYLIYATTKEIGTIDMTNEGNNVTVLWQGNNLSSLHLNKKNSILYYSEIIGQQSGLYKLSLK